MASAGRILIMPKGDWVAETEYEMLDLVSHNGRSWLAKKNAVGIEPIEENSEYWQDMFGIDLTPYAKKTDLSGYLPKSGGTLTGNTYIKKNVPEFILQATDDRTAIFQKNSSDTANGGTAIIDKSENVRTILYIQNGKLTLRKQVDGVEVGSKVIAEITE